MNKFSLLYMHSVDSGYSRKAPGVAEPRSRLKADSRITVTY